MSRRRLRRVPGPRAFFIQARSEGTYLGESDTRQGPMSFITEALATSSGGCSQKNRRPRGEGAATIYL